jgi:hypothetical protein
MNERTKTIVIGTVVGALLGAVLAWITIDGNKDEEGKPAGLTALGTGDYVQLGMSILALARQFSTMVKKT